VEATRRDVLVMGPVAAIGLSSPARAEGQDTGAGGIVPTGPKIAPYKASCVPSRVLPVFSPGGAFVPEALKANVARVAGLVERGAGEVGSRLYSFSEFCLQAAPKGATVAAWEQASIRVPGPETDRIGAAAQKAKAFVGVNVAERIDAFPGRYFLSGLIIGPSGDVILNYRKLYDLTNKARPTDMLPAWLERFGPASLYPVVDTEIGRLCSAVALDVNWPEMIRSFVFNGAEVVLNPTASPAAPGADVDVRTMVRRVRAFENLAYVLLSNLGPVGSDENAAPEARLPTEIVDYTGRAIASDGSGREGFITATIDVDALRKARTTANAQNWLAQLQVPAHLPSYQAAQFSEINGWMKTPLKDSKEHGPKLEAAIAGLVKRGVLKAPGV
jgi:predicted amidohydrolase